MEILIDDVEVNIKYPFFDKRLVFNTYTAPGINGAYVVMGIAFEAFHLNVIGSNLIFHFSSLQEAEIAKELAEIYYNKISEFDSVHAVYIINKIYTLKDKSDLIRAISYCVAGKIHFNKSISDPTYELSTKLIKWFDLALVSDFEYYNNFQIFNFRANIYHSTATRDYYGLLILGPTLEPTSISHKTNKNYRSLPTIDSDRYKQFDCFMIYFISPIAFSFKSYIHPLNKFYETKSYNNHPGFYPVFGKQL